jgi:hypothetical protein
MVFSTGWPKVIGRQVLSEHEKVLQARLERVVRAFSESEKKPELSLKSEDVSVLSN